MTRICLFFNNSWMTRFLSLVFLLLCIVFSGQNYAANQQFVVLNYHDIIEEEDKEPPFNRMDVCISHLEEQILWFKKNGYKIISVQNVLDAAEGRRSLPDKSVLLTFDDGYKSFYTRVFPLLKKYRIPATVALVGGWMDGKVPSGEVEKGFMNWEDIRELNASGLVEVASHSYDMHTDVAANPQGNRQAAFSTRWYDDAMLMYESDDQYRERVRQAIFKSAEELFQHTGKRPRVMVWPYGEYNLQTLALAQEAGFSMTMGLIDGINTLANVSAVKRMIMVDDPNIQDFATMVTTLRANRDLRVAHVDMDYLYDKDPDQTVKNIDLLLQRISDMRINTVFLQAFADPDGDGNADALYFPNRHLPVKQDLFSRVAWQLKRKAAVRVYAWLPILAYQKKLPEEWYVKEWRDGKVQAASHIYTRLSPFNPEARQFVAEIYEDLAKHASFDGLLFHDDGILSDFEDVSPLALAATKDAWGLPTDPAILRSTPEMRMQWAQHKTEFLNQFTDELTARARNFRPGLKTVRNIYALPILKPYSEEWYAQSLPSFLKHYDYVAVEAMPFMEEAQDADKWLIDLAKAVAKEPEGLNKTVFELQAMDWKTNQKIPMSTFVGQLELLKKHGVKHLGYYPDNVFEDQPKLIDLQKKFSNIVVQ